MNKIIIYYNSDNKKTTHIYPINEDFVIEAVTEFSSFADLSPTISSLVDLGNMFTTSSSGNLTKTGLNLRGMLDAPRWQKTNPVKIVVDILFYTKNDAKENVVDPINNLLGSHILNVADGKVKAPGLNAMNVDKYNEIMDTLSKNDQQTYKDSLYTKEEFAKAKEATYSSLFSVLIPGVVFLESAFFTAVRPTYSKHVTEKGYPLWASVNLEISGLTPAFISQFENGAKMGEEVVTTVGTFI